MWLGIRSYLCVVGGTVNGHVFVVLLRYDHGSCVAGVRSSVSLLVEVR